MEEKWVFGYGSLMWNPGFEYIDKKDAWIEGHHRSLCVYSFHHRGTRELPGLVLGLDEGGSCRGIAYRIDPAKWDETAAYLRAREQISMVYVETVHPVHAAGRASPLQALTYMVDRTHPQYAGKLPHEKLLQHIRQGEGRSGHCRDYVRKTLDCMRGLGIRDATLEALEAELHLLER